MTVQNKKILASLLFVLISFVCAAQNGDPAPPPPPPPTPPPGTPIDSGIMLLLFIALIYGVYRKVKFARG